MVMQISCRDRNRIAIQGDVLGAAAMGVSNILCISGDDVTAGDQPEAKRVFDEPAVKTVLAETGPAPGTTVEELRESLEDIARQHYWNEFNPPDPGGESDVIRFDEIADASVTPSRLRYRLIAIERSSKRVFAGTSRRPLAEKIAELLERLGYAKTDPP